MKTPPDCMNYEVECETLGKLCEELSIDCSGCYDKNDLIKLIKREFEDKNSLKIERVEKERDDLLEKFNDLKHVAEEILFRCKEHPKEINQEWVELELDLAIKKAEAK